MLKTAIHPLLFARLRSWWHNANGHDVLTIWLFASLLTLPGAGELTLALYLLLVLGWLGMRFRSRHTRPLPWRSLLPPTLAIASIALVKLLSTLWSLNPTQSLSNVSTHLHFLVFLPLALGFWRARQPLNALLLGVHMATAGLLVWSLWFWWVHGLGFDPMVRLEAGAQNPGVLGQLAGVQALWLAWAWRCRPTWGRLFWALAAVCPVIAAGGRSHIVVMACAWVLIALLACRDRQTWAERIRIVGATAALCGGLALALMPRMELAWIEATDYGTTPETTVGSSVGNRIGIWDAAQQAFPDAPWLGFGAGTSREVVARYSPVNSEFAVTSHYHNQLLQVVMETGLMGLALCLLALALLSRWFFIRRENHPHLWPSYAWLVFSTATVGLFTGSLQQGLLHSFIVASLAVMAAQALQDNPSSRGL